MTRRPTYPLLLLALITVTASGQSLPPASAVDTADWACEYCPFDAGYRGEYNSGLTHVSEDAALFGDGTGYDEQGVYLNLDGAGSYSGERGRATWVVEDLGLDARRLALAAVLPVGLDLRADYSELPRNVFDTTSTVFGVSNGLLTLPAQWQTAGLTSGFSDLNASLSNVDIRSERKTLRLRGRYRLSTPLRLHADYRRRERDGNDVLGGAFFTQASLLPRAIDQQTDEVDLGVSWTGTRGHAALGWYGSWFRNKIVSTTWDNPFTAPAGASRGRLAEAPDNSASQLSARGQYRFDTLDTVVQASAALGRMEQNDALLAYTINPLITTDALPRARLDASVDTSALAFSLTSRPHERARVRAAWRFDERDNGTPRESWQRVIVDSFASGETQLNTPYGFQRTRIRLDGDIDLPRALQLSAGLERTEFERDFQEVAKQTEDGGWGRLRWRPRAGMDLSLKAGNANRDIDRYDTTIALDFGQNPLLRKYNLAYRYREYAQLQANASLENVPLSMAFSTSYADDSYTRSTLGLISGKEWQVAADVDYAISERASLVVSAGWHSIEAIQTGSESFAAVDWRARHDDDFINAGFGVRFDDIAGRADLSFDYMRTDGDSDIRIFEGLVPSAFPALTSTRDSYRVRVRYRGWERVQADVRLRYERFNSADWSLQGVQPATVPNVLTLGADPYDYNVLMISVGARYQFGAN